jgi:allantoinase
MTVSNSMEWVSGNATGGLSPSLLADAQILELAANTRVRCHIVHSTIAAGNRIARHYCERCARISVETCLHYFMFNGGDAVRQGAFLKLNPSLRAEKERLELWRGLADGEIDLVYTDHVAWPIARKSDSDMGKNGSEIPGLETLLLYSGAVKERALSRSAVARLTAESPAKHFGLYPQNGTRSVGADADIAVFCPQERIFAPEAMISAVKSSPFAVMTMVGFVRATFVHGRKGFDNRRVTVKPGAGQFVRPKWATMS